MVSNLNMPQRCDLRFPVCYQTCGSTVASVEAEGRVLTHRKICFGSPLKARVLARRWERGRDEREWCSTWCSTCLHIFMNNSRIEDVPYCALCTMRTLYYLKSGFLVPIRCAWRSELKLLQEVWKFVSKENINSEQSRQNTFSNRPSSGDTWGGCDRNFLYKCVISLITSICNILLSSLIAQQ